MSPDVFTVDVVHEHGVAVVRVAGEVDMAAVPEIRAALALLDAEQETPDVTVDLSAVSFMDSSGLNLLVGTLKELRARDGRLTLTNPQAGVLRLLELTGLTSLFDITFDIAAHEPAEEAVDTAPGAGHPSGVSGSQQPA